MLAGKTAAVLAAIVLGALALPTAAAAGNPPTCWSTETWARPGLTREHDLYCARTSMVELVTAPAHGVVTGLRMTSHERVGWSYRPADGAPERDAFEILLSGSAGSSLQRVDVNVVPTAQNTAPVCQPVQDAQRTAGTAPAELRLQLDCWDFEHDGMELDGAGPGVHLDAPLRLEGGDASGVAPFWRYRTAALAGPEAATYWATDDLGARSAETAISVEVGPHVDRRPDCRPTTSWSQAPYPIPMRAGATRRFGLHCQDADGDAFDARIGTPPRHGRLAVFEPGPLQPLGLAAERWIDVAYVPDPGWGAEDRFTVATADRAGRGLHVPLAMTPVPLPENGGGGCGWAQPELRPDRPGLVWLVCDDVEGDPIEVTIAQQPGHGVAGPPILTPARYGRTEVSIAYMPDPGFTGFDVLRLLVHDGVGDPIEQTFDLYVGERAPAPMRPPSPGDPLPYPEPGSLPAQGTPAVGQPPPVAPGVQARAALAARRVVLVKRAGAARIYAARGARRRGIRPGRPALAVTCALPCRLDARARRARPRTKLDRQRATAEPGRAATIRLTRRTARRAGRRVVFDVRVRPRPGRAVRARVGVRVRRR